MITDSRIFSEYILSFVVWIESALIRFVIGLTIDIKWVISIDEMIVSSLLFNYVGIRATVDWCRVSLELIFWWLPVTAVSNVKRCSNHRFNYGSRFSKFFYISTLIDYQLSISKWNKHRLSWFWIMFSDHIAPLTWRGLHGNVDSIKRVTWIMKVSVTAARFLLWSGLYHALTS